MKVVDKKTMKLVFLTPDNHKKLKTLAVQYDTTITELRTPL